MRSKAPLLLMEQMVMLLVFALAAAICLQAFVKSDGLSGDSEDRDRAIAQAQTAAEVIRHTGGDFQKAAEILGTQLWDEESLQVSYGSGWEPAAPETPGVYPFGYTLGAARRESGVPGLGKAEIWVQKDDPGSGPVGSDLVRFQVCWQVPVTVEVEVDDGRE